MSKLADAVAANAFGSDSADVSDLLSNYVHLATSEFGVISDSAARAGFAQALETSVRNARQVNAAYDYLCRRYTISQSLKTHVPMTNSEAHTIGTFRWHYLKTYNTAREIGFMKAFFAARFGAKDVERCVKAKEQLEDYANDAYDIFADTGLLPGRRPDFEAEMQEAGDKHVKAGRLLRAKAWFTQNSERNKAEIERLKKPMTTSDFDASFEWHANYEIVRAYIAHGDKDYFKGNPGYKVADQGIETLQSWQGHAPDYSGRFQRCRNGCHPRGVNTNQRLRRRRDSAQNA